MRDEQIRIQALYLKLARGSSLLGIQSLEDLLKKQLALIIIDLVNDNGNTFKLERIFSEYLDEYGFRNDMSEEERLKVKNENAWIKNIRKCNLPR